MATALLDKSQYLYIGILNDNPSLQADVKLSNGYFNIVDTSGNGAGWGTTGTNLIKYSNIQTNTVLGGVGTWFEAYSLGVYQITRVTTSGYTPVVGARWQVIVTKIGDDNNPYTQIFTYFCATAVIATEVTAFAAMITAQSGGNVTAANAGNNLTIQGNFGDVNLEVFGFSVQLGGQIANAALSITTPLVQASGTPAIVNTLLGGSGLVVGATYNTYGFTFYNFSGADESLKQNEQVPINGIVFVDATADSGAGSFNQAWIHVLSGVFTPVSAYL